MIKQSGWSLSIAKYTTNPIAHDSITGHWLIIHNTTVGNGNILRVSNLGTYTISSANDQLGIGVNQYGDVKPLKGTANFKFHTDHELSKINFMNRQFTLKMCNNGTALKLTEGSYSVLALDSNGLWRYEGYHGAINHDGDGRILILRTMTNVNK